MDVSKPKHRYVALDSLRGICACMVVLFHLADRGPLSLVPMIRHGWLFVDFFFVLSGFVIGSTYGTRLAEGYSASDYMTRRFFRIYPLHLVVLGVYLLFECLLALLDLHGANRRPFDGIYSVDSFFYSLFLVQIFLGPSRAPWNLPSWSIAAEFWTYLIFALAMKLRPRLIVPLCLLVAAIVPVYLARLTDQNIAVNHDGALARCLYGFCVGLLWWKVPARLRDLRLARWADTLLELGAVGLCILFSSMVGAGRLSLAAPWIFLFAVAVFSRERGPLSRVLKQGPFVTTGNLSYAIYMIHAFLLWRFLNLLRLIEPHVSVALVPLRRSSSTADMLAQLACALVFLIGVIFAAWLANRFVEVPGQRLGRWLTARDGTGHAMPALVPGK